MATAKTLMVRGSFLRRFVLVLQNILDGVPV